MIAPGQTFAASEALCHQRFIVIHGGDSVESANHRRWTFRISKHRALFGSEKKAVTRRVIANVARSRLSAKPFAKLSLAEFGSLGQLLRTCSPKLGQQRRSRRVSIPELILRPQDIVQRDNPDRRIFSR